MKKYILFLLLICSLQACHEADIYEQTPGLKAEKIQPERVEQLKKIAADYSTKFARFYSIPAENTPLFLEVMDSDHDYSFYMHSDKVQKSLEESYKQNQEIFLHNTLILESFTEDYGWPSEEILGEKSKVSPMLFNIPLSKYEDMQPLLYQEMKAGRMEAILYAKFIDNMRLNQDRLQLYGTFVEFDKDMKLSLPVIENLEATNQARKEIGLPPLEAGNYSLK
jgi:hypothetical protein